MSATDLGVTPGVLADAHKVRDIARYRYRLEQKERIRRYVVAWLRDCEPSLVLDLWGGGTSAELMVASGLSVLSVDRPGGKTGWSALGVTPQRARRALNVCAAETGYRAGWGPAERFAKECDAAFYDLCGQWSMGTHTLLSASRHMKRVVLTLMPERTEIADSRLPIDQWVVATRALVEDALKMRAVQVRKYRRESNQWAIVFFCRPVLGDRAARIWEAARSADPEFRARRREQEKARYAAIKADPVRYARQVEMRAAYYASLMADPETRERVKARDRARYAERVAKRKAAAA